MNSNYLLHYPTSIRFGADCILTLPEELPVSVGNIVLVTGTHAEKSGILAGMQELLSAFSVRTVSGISAEPPLEDVDRIITEGRLLRADCVIGLGGGSVMDAAKAAAALIPLEGFCSDYFSGKREITRKGLFFVAIPTTAGTGAEMTNNSVLTDAATQVKKSLRSPWMVADLALIDPILTLSCPPLLSAASGLDAYIQAAEAYTSPKASSVVKALAYEALGKIFRNLKTVCNTPEDRNARTEMAEGSMMSGMAFSQCGLGAIHGLAHPVGSLLHVPHGVACAILMPFVFEWNRSLCEKDYAELAGVCGLPESADAFVAASRELAEALGIPADFSKYGLAENHFDFIVKNCRSASMNSNPRPMSDEDVRKLLFSLL